MCKCLIWEGDSKCWGRLAGKGLRPLLLLLSLFQLPLLLPLGKISCTGCPLTSLLFPFSPWIWQANAQLEFTTAHAKRHQLLKQRRKQRCKRQGRAF